MPEDNFGDHAAALSSPASSGFAITPDDDEDLERIPRAIYIGGGGSLAVTTKGGDTLTFVGLATGSTLPVRCARVLATGTTCTSLIGLD